MITIQDMDSSAAKYAEDIIKSFKLCSDVSDEFIRGVEEIVEEAFLASMAWAMKQTSEKGGEA